MKILSIHLVLITHQIMIMKVLSVNEIFKIYFVFEQSSGFYLFAGEDDSLTDKSVELLFYH